MSRKHKENSRRWLTASNLFIAHVALHVIFVFGYWFSVIASLSFSGVDFLENHLLAFLTDAASNHLALLLILIIHTLVFVASRWWKQRQQGGEIREYNEELGHLTAEEKLELLLDEVVELREAMHEREVANQTRNPDLAAQRLRERDQEAEDEMILLDEYQVEKAREGS